MKRIYTRTGDSGTTAIHGGLRVPKTDVRIEANGCIDELNVAIGIVRTSMPSDHEWQPLLKEIQLNLMTSMSLVATRSDMKEKNPNSLPDNLVELLEKQIDAINALCTPATSFILPGGTPLASHHDGKSIGTQSGALAMETARSGCCSYGNIDLPEPSVGFVFYNVPLRTSAIGM